MKKIICWVAVLGLYLLPLAGRAWLIEPENVLESKEDLPGDVRGLLPDFPDLELADEVYNSKNVLYAAPSVESALVDLADTENIGSLFIIGAVSDGWYHVMNFSGDQGYIQSKWFGEGNG